MPDPAVVGIGLVLEELLAADRTAPALAGVEPAPRVGILAEPGYLSRAEGQTA